MYTFYPKQSNATLALFLPQMAQFMNNNLGGFTGPGWLVVEAYSQNAAAPHAVPAAGLITNLAGDNSWIAGSAMTINDYIIFESTSGAFKFQVGFKYQGATTIRQIVAPLEGWNVGFGTNTMEDAGNWLNIKYPNVDCVVTNPTVYSIIADADHMNYFGDDGATRFVQMIGKISGGYSADNGSDVVISTQSSYVYCGLFATGAAARQWYKLNNVNQASVLAVWGGVEAYIGNQDMISTNTAYLQDGNTGNMRCLPLSMSDLDDPGLLGLFGYYPMWTTWKGVNGLGTFTLGGKTYVGISNNTSYGPLIFPWDGATVMP
jgi:hypothetical protein